MGGTWSSVCKSAYSRSLQVSLDINAGFCIALVPLTLMQTQTENTKPLREMLVLITYSDFELLYYGNIQRMHARALPSVQFKAKHLAALRRLHGPHVLWKRRRRSIMGGSQA